MHFKKQLVEKGFFKRKQFLLMVDNFSGYSFYKQFSKAPNSSQVIEHIISWFLQYGFPNKIRLDFGPLYKPQFADFCRQAMIYQKAMFARR